MERYSKQLQDTEERLAIILSDIYWEKFRLAKSIPLGWDFNYLVANLGMQQHYSWNVLWETRLCKLYRKAEKLAKSIEFLWTKVEQYTVDNPNKSF